MTDESSPEVELNKPLSLHLTVAPSTRAPEVNPPDEVSVRRALSDPHLRAHLALCLSANLETRASMKFTPENVGRIMLDDAYRQGSFDILAQLYALGEQS